jgi:hypothetical protein
MVAAAQHGTMVGYAKLEVFENTESTKRQYALRDRAVSLGWPIERIHVIDNAWSRCSSRM